MMKKNNVLTQLAIVEAYAEGPAIDIDGNIQTQDVDAENLIQSQLKFENLWNFKRLLTIVPASKNVVISTPLYR
jgi:hypothetical protein